MNNKTIDLYDGNRLAELRGFNSNDYINKLFEECLNNDYKLVLDYFTTDEEGIPETHYWNIRMVDDSVDYEDMFNKHYESLMRQFKEISKESSLEELSDGLKTIYAQYLKPLISDDKVKEAYERYEYIGDAYAAYLMTVYAQRLFKLIKLGAPIITVNNEKRYFINAMIASSTWVTEIEPTDLIYIDKEIVI